MHQSIRVSELSRCIDMDLKPTLDELLDTFINKEDVEKIVRAPVKLIKKNNNLFFKLKNLRLKKYNSRVKNSKEKEVII